MTYGAGDRRRFLPLTGYKPRRTRVPAVRYDSYPSASDDGVCTLFLYITTGYRDSNPVYERYFNVPQHTRSSQPPSLFGRPDEDNKNART